MPNQKSSSDSSSNNKSFMLAVDTWAVIVALILALAVRFDILKNVPW